MLILAPMQGLTELLFRRAFARCYPDAFDCAVSPFLPLTVGNPRDTAKLLADVWPEANVGAMPLVPQILGRNIEEFVTLANRLNDLGYSEVNWNIGCPMRRIAAKRRGSGILPYPDEVRRVLDGVVPRIRPALSVKMRLGYYDDSEIDALIPVLNGYPLASVAIHPRIGKQMYNGQVRIDRFADVLTQIRHRVVYNGDIVSVADYSRIRTRFPEVRDVMIGRGALYNPQLPSIIRHAFPDDFPSQADTTLCPVSEFIRQLVSDILSLDMPNVAKMRKIKEYWCLLSKSLPGTEADKRRVLQALDLEAILSLVFEMIK